MPDQNFRNIGMLLQEMGVERLEQGRAALRPAPRQAVVDRRLEGVQIWNAETEPRAKTQTRLYQNSLMRYLRAHKYLSEVKLHLEAGMEAKGYKH